MAFKSPLKGVVHYPSKHASSFLSKKEIVMGPLWWNCLWVNHPACITPRTRPDLTLSLRLCMSVRLNMHLSLPCCIPGESFDWLAVLWQVNSRKLYQPEDGVQLTIIDGHDGRLVESKGFRNSILQGIPAQIDNYISGLRDGWDVDCWPTFTITSGHWLF